MVTFRLNDREPDRAPNSKPHRLLPLPAVVHMSDGSPGRIRCKRGSAPRSKARRLVQVVAAGGAAAALTASLSRPSGSALPAPRGPPWWPLPGRARPLAVRERVTRCWRLRCLRPPQTERAAPASAICFRKVGSGGARGAVRLTVVHPGPGLLKQHGVQRSDGAHLHAGSPKSHPQRANDSVHMDLAFRDQNVPASDQQGLL
eukprot:scaffold46445_cov59-Phaeocystis_antarctica.AAC.6